MSVSVREDIDTYFAACTPLRHSSGRIKQKSSANGTVETCISLGQIYTLAGMNPR